MLCSSDGTHGHINRKLLMSSFDSCTHLRGAEALFLVSVALEVYKRKKGSSNDALREIGCAKISDAPHTASTSH